MDTRILTQCVCFLCFEQSDLRRELPELANTLRADQSFANALEIEKGKGWKIVKGFAVYDLYDCPEGDAFVGYKHWWNVSDDGTWCVYGSLPRTYYIELCTGTLPIIRNRSMQNVS